MELLTGTKGVVTHGNGSEERAIDSIRLRTDNDY